MILLGLDIATTTGIAVMDGDKIVNAFAYRAKGEGDAEVFDDWRGWFSLMLDRYEVAHCAIEQPLPTDLKVPNRAPNARPGETRNPVTMQTYLRLYGLRAHAVQIAKAKRIPLLEVHQSTWRKSFTGNGKAKKDETLALAKRVFPGIKSKDAAEAIGVVWHLSGHLKAAKLHRPGELFFGATA